MMDCTAPSFTRRDASELVTIARGTFHPLLTVDAAVTVPKMVSSC